MEKFHWQIARVKKILQETATVKTFTLTLPQWQPHLAGQHYDIRLTAEDGYQAERSYSIASPPEQVGEIELTVELIDGGEISVYLHGGVSIGDPLEVRGPIGGYFVWGQKLANLPLLLIGGGSGVVPLMCILRHREAIKATNPTSLLLSARTFEAAIYRNELQQLSQKNNFFSLYFTFTRQSSPGAPGYQRRVNHEMLTEVLKPFSELPQTFVCGPSKFVEFVANTLVDMGLPPATVRTERFGPT